MRYFIVISLFCYFNITVFSQDRIQIENEVIALYNPLDTLKFDQIIAFNINYDSVNHRKTLFQDFNNADKYKLYSKYSSSKRIVDKKLFESIIRLFSDTATYGNNYADCFEPRFVLQFKLDGRDKFRIIICEGCEFLISTLPIPAAYLKYYDNEYEIEGKKMIHRRYLKGFSEKGAIQINELCKKLNLGYCED